MNFTENIFKRATVKGVADYLLYGMVPDQDDRSYESRLNDADRDYERVAKQYDTDGASVLLSAANTLVNENASVYMELGLLAGFLLITDISQYIYRERNQTISSIVSNDHKTQEEQRSDIKSEIDTDMEPEIGQTVLQQFIRNRLDTALEDTLRKDRKYQKSKQNAEAKTDKLTRDMFTTEQWNLIDDALEESNAAASEYGRVAYQQGLFDALDIFKEIIEVRL